MSLMEKSLFHVFAKPILDYSRRWAFSKALPYWQRLTGKRQGFDDPSNLITAAASGELADGTIVEVPGLLSKFSFRYRPHAQAPFYFAGTIGEIAENPEGGGTASFKKQEALAPCGMNPMFSTGHRLLYLYRPVFKKFPSVFPAGPDAAAHIERLKRTYQYLPVLAPDAVLTNTERRLSVVAEARYLPRDVLAELFGTSAEEFAVLEATGQNLALLVREEHRNEIEIHSSLDRMQTHLWAGLFAEVHVEPALPHWPEPLLGIIGSFFRDAARKIMPTAGPEIAEEHRAAGATHGINRVDFWPQGLHIWSITPLYVAYQAPGFFALHMASDLRADPVRDEVVFYQFAELVSQHLPAVLQELDGVPRDVYVDFVSNFAQARNLGLSPTGAPVFDRVVDDEAKKNTLAWLRG